MDPIIDTVEGEVIDGVKQVAEMTHEVVDTVEETADMVHDEIADASTDMLDEESAEAEEVSE